MVLVLTWCVLEREWLTPFPILVQDINANILHRLHDKGIPVRRNRYHQVNLMEILLKHRHFLLPILLLTIYDQRYIVSSILQSM